MGFNNILKLLLILIITVSGCSGKRTEAEKTEISSEKRIGTESTEITEKTDFGGKGDRIKKVQIGNKEKKSVKPVQNFINTEENKINKYFLLSELSGNIFIAPEDFEIGELYQDDKETSDAAAIIIDFFSELKEKSVKKELIDEEKRFYLGKIFDEYVKNNYIPETLRIGSPLILDGKMHFNVRFIKNSGKTEGEIIIIRKKNKWFIQGFEGDLSLLEEEEQNRDERFEPEIYRFQ